MNLLSTDWCYHDVQDNDQDDSHPPPPGTSSGIWFSSDRVTVTGHQPAAVPTAPRQPLVPTPGPSWACGWVSLPYGGLHYIPSPVHGYSPSLLLPLPPTLLLLDLVTSLGVCRVFPRFLTLLVWDLLSLL